MANCAIVGINWGDEGKGRMVDYLTGQYDVVVRYQGGGNAGHTVINDMGKFALHLLPSGVFRPGVMNILGNGVALDCENLVTEMERIRAAGVSISPENLMVSHRASLLLPWHRELDALEEARLKDKMYGSTKQGIAPFYSDKYQKKTIQAGELLYPDRLMAHLQDLLEWKNLILQKVYGAKGHTMAEMTAWLETYAAQVRPYVADTGRYLRQAQAAGKAILFESALYAKMPEDMSEPLALAALDVAGAPAQARKLPHEGDSVLILGANGKSGVLCGWEAMKKVGPKGKVVGVVRNPKQVPGLMELGVYTDVIVADCTKPVEVMEAALAANDGKEYDLSICCVNIESCEMSAILPVRDDGLVYFFSMATSFTKAALGAEGIGKDVTMIIGNGYTKNHAQITLDVLRENPKLRKLFDEKYC